MVEEGSLVDGAGVVIQTPGDGQVNGEVGLRHAEGGQVYGDGLQLGKALVEHFVPAGVALQSGQNLGVGTMNGDEEKDFVRLIVGQAAVLQQDQLDLFGADLVQLVHGTHDVPGLFGQTQHGVEAVENLPVVHPDLEPAQAEAPEDLVDDGGNLRFIQNVQLAVADDVDVRLVELPEPTPLGTLAPVDLADLIAAEGEGQLVIVKSHIFGQGHGQVEAQSQVAVALGKAVDLLLGLAAALGKENLGILDDRGVQGGEAVGGVSRAQNFQHFLKANLLAGEQLQEAGQSTGLDDFHDGFPFLLEKGRREPREEGNGMARL